jgi:glycosyltransferase involved in cell wall biosynthesis
MRYPEKQLPVLFYVLKAAGKVEKAALAEEASVIQAASNHVNALPALLAARRLGRSFHYEMRGLWELTRASRQPGYEKTQGYRQGLELEGMVARRADRVLVISEQLGLFIQKRWNIPSERLLLLPNCADPALRPADQEEVELNTIGYAGSLISYEGLDTLIEAVAMLRNRGLIVKVRLAGEGEARSELENQVNQLELTEQVKFFGLVTPDEARDILRRCSLVCIPRRPFQVCSLVPPIKLVEAMTLGKPLLVPDLPIFRDELGDSGGGLFFESGNPDSLAKAISLAINRPEDLALMGRLARYYALEQRSWSRFTAKLADPVEDQLAGWKGVNL